MKRLSFIKIFFISYFILSSSFVFCDIGNCLRFFLKGLCHYYMELYRKKEGKRELLHKHIEDRPFIDEYRDIEWDYYTMKRSSLSSRLKKGDEYILRIIDKACINMSRDERERESYKEEMITILSESEPETRSSSVRSSTERFEFESILSEVLAKFIFDVHQSTASTRRADWIAYFLLDQFPHIRPTFFRVRSPRYREFNRFVHRLREKIYLCWNDEGISKFWDEESGRCVRIKAISAGMRYLREK